jgi:hypothetical protein
MWTTSTSSAIRSHAAPHTGTSARGKSAQGCPGGRGRLGRR